MAKDTRLQKMLADCGVASRRKAEEMIRAGLVTVNGETAQIGDKVDPRRDRVEVKGRSVRAREENVYIMLHKPRGFITTMSDEMGRKCVAELVRDIPGRIYPVGRLDRDSEGLLLMTNDGNFANMMMHPKHQIPKIYHVRVRGEVSAAALDKLSHLTVLEDCTQIQPVECHAVLKDEKSTVLSLTLYEGKNRQIRKMCDACDLTIQRLQRVAIGKVEMGDLKVGEWKHLTPKQLQQLGWEGEAPRRSAKNDKYRK